MRIFLTGLASLILMGLLATSISAATLQEKDFETAFALAYVDVDDFGKTTTLDGQWQWLFGKSYNEFGAKLSYLNVDPDSGSGTDATIFGPVYTWNWTPASEKATGFLEGFYGFVSGDLGDSADDALEASIGAKVFVGDSAAVRLDYFVQRLFGDDGFDDQDSSGIRVGISIFGGQK